VNAVSVASCQLPVCSGSLRFEVALSTADWQLATELYFFFKIKFRYFITALQKQFIGLTTENTPSVADPNLSTFRPMKMIRFIITYDRRQFLMIDSSPPLPCENAWHTTPLLHF